MLTSSMTTPTTPLLTMGGGIDVDATAVISGVVFLALMLLLHQILFKPYLAILEKRESMTDGAGAEAAAAEQEAASKRAEYATAIEAARAEATKVRDELRAKGKADEEQILAAARSEAASFAASAREALESQAASASAQVEAQARLLASAIVNRAAPEA